MTPVEITMKSSRRIQNLLKLRIIPVKYVYYFFIIASYLYLPSLLHTSAFLTEKQKFASTRRKKKKPSASQIMNLILTSLYLKVMRLLQERSFGW